MRIHDPVADSQTDHQVPDEHGNGPDEEQRQQVKGVEAHFATVASHLWIRPRNQEGDRVSCGVKP